MGQPSNPESYWDNAMKNLDLDNFNFKRFKSSSFLKDFCKNHLNPGARVLDLGCGFGRNSQYLAENGYVLIGVDISQHAVEFCRKRFEKFDLQGDFKTGVFNNIPFESGFFSAVVCIASLDHVTFETAEQSIIEMRRTLSSIGHILLTFDPEDTDEDRLNEVEILPDGTLRFVTGDQAGMLFRRYSDSDIESLINRDNIITFTKTKTGNRIIVCR